MQHMGGSLTLRFPARPEVRNEAGDKLAKAALGALHDAFARREVYPKSTPPWVACTAQHSLYFSCCAVSFCRAQPRPAGGNHPQARAITSPTRPFDRHRIRMASLPDLLPVSPQFRPRPAR